MGVPEEVLSDMGTQFVSSCMQEVSRLLNIRQLTTTPYHPICNGLVEKFNGTLKMMLRRLCSEQPRQWNRYINALLFAYREVPQASTVFAPFELLYGRTVRGPMRIIRHLWTGETDRSEVRSSYQYVFELRERLEETMRIAQEELAKAQHRQKLYYDRGAKERTFEIGDRVLILLPTDTNKLLMQWRGPYLMEGKICLNDYRIRIKGKSKTYHINLLRRFYDRGDSEEKPVEEVVNACSGGPVLLELVNAAVIQEDEPEDSECNDMSEVGTCCATESFRDMTLSGDLNWEQKKEVEELIEEFQRVFTDLPGTTELVAHHIRLTSDSVRQSLADDIQKMLQMGVIRRSSSPYSSPVIIVRKRDGTNRICVDYRKLNSLTVFDSEPMIPMSDLIQKLGKGEYFSKLDLSKGYWQIPVADQDIEKTGFCDAGRML